MAVWVSEVRMETCLPSCPVEMTSYSEERGGQQSPGHGPDRVFTPGGINCSLPVVSLSDFSQSRMTKDGHPSTVTTVRLEGGDLGGAVTFAPLGPSLGK